MKFFAITILLLTSLLRAQETITANVYFNQITGKYNYVVSDAEDPNAIASGTLIKTYEKEGWDQLSISSYKGTDNKYPDYAKAYAMGYLEGIITAEKIYFFYLGIRKYKFSGSTGEIPETSRRFLKENLDYMKYNAAKKKDTDPYWEHVYYIYKQLQGLVDGYNSATKYEKIPMIDFQMMNGMSDFDELEYYQNKTARPNFNTMTSEEKLDFIAQHTHCSALIKVLPDFSDVFFGHTTWSSYNELLKMFKEYSFKTNKGHEKSTSSAFCSYPGTISSTDDFYINDNEVYVTETTLQVFREELYDNMTPKSLLSWLRVILANRLSSTSSEWVEIFRKENSGTGNNQWQILDMKLIDLEKKKISDGAFFIIEQLPGYTQAKDMTTILKRGYWPSYNSGAMEETRNISGQDEAIKNDTSLYDPLDYYGGARAKIFRRDQGNVLTLDDMKKIMRYNDYKNDEFSKGKPELTLASRFDLREEPEKVTCFGATDAKVASVKELKSSKNKKIHIINGPTNDNQPSFSWKNTTCYKKNPEKWSYEGQVELYNFSWMEYVTKTFENENNIL